MICNLSFSRVFMFYILNIINKMKKTHPIFMWQKIIFYFQSLTSGGLTVYWHNMCHNISHIYLCLPMYIVTVASLSYIITQRSNEFVVCKVMYIYGNGALQFMVLQNQEFYLPFKFNWIEYLFSLPIPIKTSMHNWYNRAIFCGIACHIDYNLF